MNWIEVAIAGWLLASIGFALLIGQSIRLSDRRAHGQGKRRTTSTTSSAIR